MNYEILKLNSTKLTVVNLVARQDDAVSLQGVDDFLVFVSKGSDLHVEERRLSEALLDVSLVGLDLHETFPDISLERHKVLKLGVKLALLCKKRGDQRGRNLTSSHGNLHSGKTREYYLYT